MFKAFLRCTQMNIWYILYRYIWVSTSFENISTMVEKFSCVRWNSLETPNKLSVESICHAIKLIFGCLFPYNIHTHIHIRTQTLIQLRSNNLKHNIVFKSMFFSTQSQQFIELFFFSFDKQFPPSNIIYSHNYSPF